MIPSFQKGDGRAEKGVGERKLLAPRATRDKNGVVKVKTSPSGAAPKKSMSIYHRTLLVHDCELVGSSSRTTNINIIVIFITSDSALWYNLPGI